MRLSVRILGLELLEISTDAKDDDFRDLRGEFVGFSPPPSEFSPGKGWGLPQ